MPIFLVYLVIPLLGLIAGPFVMQILVNLLSPFPLPTIAKVIAISACLLVIAALLALPLLRTESFASDLAGWLAVTSFALSLGIAPAAFSGLVSGLVKAL